jgi:hypothetical protein
VAVESADVEAATVEIEQAAATGLCRLIEAARTPGDADRSHGDASVGSQSDERSETGVVSSQGGHVHPAVDSPARLGEEHGHMRLKPLTLGMNGTADAGAEIEQRTQERTREHRAAMREG